MAKIASVHGELYDMLLDNADLMVEVDEVIVGLNWTFCRAGSCGLAPTLSSHTSRPSWQGPLQGRALGELSAWITSWDRWRSSLALSAINAALNREADLVTCNGAIFKGIDAMQQSIDWFYPMLQGERVAVIGPSGSTQRRGP